MRRSIFLVILIIFFSVSSSAQDSSKISIIILSVDLNVNTSSRVSCDDFVRQFSQLLNYREVLRDDSLAMFLSFIKKAKYSRTNRGIDVRWKFIYELGDTNKNTVCTDGHNIILDGRLLKQNVRFMAFLKSLVSYRSSKSYPQYNH